MPQLNGALCSALGTVFAIGGADGWEPNDEVQKFSVENNWWDETTSMPTARYGHAAVGVDNFCFVFGGAAPAPEGKGEVVLSEVEVMDALKETWGALPPMPTPRWGISAAVESKSKRIYVVGGFDQLGRALGTVEVFDASSRTWVLDGTVPAQIMPTPRGALAVGIVGLRMFAAGGIDASRKELSTVEVMNLSSGNWSDDTPLPAPRGACAGVVCNGAFAVIGGSENAGTQTSDSVYAVQVNKPATTNTTTTMPPLSA